MYNLPAAALAAALPLLRQRFAGWQPLAEPDRGLRDMQRWRPLLQSDSARDAIFQVHTVASTPALERQVGVDEGDRVLCVNPILGPTHRLAPRE